MAVFAAAQLLDELMGRHRNVAPNEKVQTTDWEDPEFCKFFMVKFCPHDLFVNTRADLGPCLKTHDEEAKKLFEEAKKTHFKKIQYQEDFIRFCTSMLNDVERKIVKGRQRLALSGKNVLASTNPQLAEKNAEKIGVLNERINELEKEAEQAGTDGNVEQAQGLMKLCDQLKEERDSLKRAELGTLGLTAQLAVEQEKQMEVCEVCGAFLIVGDAQQRIDDHLMGKQHMGYMRLKTALEEITDLVRELKEPKKFGREGERSRDRDRSRSRQKMGEKEKRNDDRYGKERRHRGHSRDEEGKQGERSRDKERRHHSDKEDRHRHHHHHHHHSHRHRR
ncbi:luc7-like protein 3 [Anthonomus grandis grandis]|uniref:luc7-like protein 3 n=1 Tax=Anthonomus grandis grandis TaxID=2921223 RepID=UPI002166A7E4|nr:luc7-like protein 3 [Anthonomus grandis grandis]